MNSGSDNVNSSGSSDESEDSDSLFNISEQQNKRIYLFIPGGFLCVNPSRI